VRISWLERALHTCNLVTKASSPILLHLEVVAVQQSRADRLLLDNFLQPVSDAVWQLEQGNYWMGSLRDWDELQNS